MSKKVKITLVICVAIVLVAVLALIIVKPPENNHNHTNEPENTPGYSENIQGGEDDLPSATDKDLNAQQNEEKPPADQYATATGKDLVSNQADGAGTN